MASESPLFQRKHFTDPAVFHPENLLREARRQKSLPDGSVPAVCVLDPDGDIVAHLLQTGRATRDPAWACYHSILYRFTNDDLVLGIIGCAVGGPFAVLLAEQLFVSGCALLISITSAGQIVPVGAPPYFVFIEQALRDEGTSHHYLPPSRDVSADKFTMVETVKTEVGARTMAVDPKTHRLFLPSADYEPPATPTKENQNPRRKMIAGSFKVLVLEP